MNILGLTYLSHDCGSAVLVDGKLVAAAEEERFNRLKHSTAFPAMSIEYCLNTAGITPQELDCLILPSKPFIHILNRLKYAANIFPKTWKFIWDNIYKSAWNYKMCRFDAPNNMGIGKKTRVLSVEHHLAHASSAFYCSPFDEAAILTTDGRGEWPCLLFGHGQGNSIKTISKTYFPHSLGQIYQAITEYLGFHDYGDEYKVMGLSGYGQPKHIELMREIIQFSNGTLTINQKFMNYHIFNRGTENRFSAKLDEKLKCRRAPGGEILQEHMDVAASIQERLNEVSLEIACYLKKITGSENLCIAGGVALNGVMNNYIKANSSFKNIYISPVSNDTGLGLGAALYANHAIFNKPRGFVMDHTYWGPEFDDMGVKSKLDTYELPYVELKDPARTGAELISQGRVVGWFQGRMEYGSRALGNRSILADPRDATNKDKINMKIKFREEFRPFAPAVLMEKAGEYFSLHDSPFMLMVCDVIKKDDIPAVTHVDGTARIQTVEAKTNPLFASLIKHFEKITGVPIVINTSFNVKGEPIVCTPDDALRCFYTSGIDDLIIGRYQIYKSEKGLN